MLKGGERKRKVGYCKNCAYGRKRDDGLVDCIIFVTQKHEHWNCPHFRKEITGEMSLPFRLVCSNPECLGEILTNSTEANCPNCGSPMFSHDTPQPYTPSEGVKYDQDKLRFDLLPIGPLNELVKVYTMGAKKYTDRNWEKGIAYGRVYAAVMRHLTAFWSGEDIDSESGLPHLAHVAWGCFALMEYLNTHPEMDDRSK
jgi:hypothetical protein